MPHCKGGHLPLLQALFCFHLPTADVAQSLETAFVSAKALSDFKEIQGTSLGLSTRPGTTAA